MELLDSARIVVRFRFCQRWLVWVNVFFAVVGLVIAVAGHTIVFEIWNRAAANAFFGGEFPEAFEAYRRLLFGIAGGTIAGFHLLMAAVAAIPLARGEKWSLWALSASLLIWFAIDSTISLLAGGLFNVLLINVFALLCIGVPLAIAWMNLPPRTLNESAPISAQ